MLKLLLLGPVAGQVRQNEVQSEIRLKISLIWLVPILMDTESGKVFEVTS